MSAKDSVSSCVASSMGLTLSDQKLALRQLGPDDPVSSLFFVLIERGLDGEFAYLINKVSLTTHLGGMRCKIPKFHFSLAMVDYLEKIRVSRYYLESNGKLWPIRGPYSFNALRTCLALVMSGDEGLWFDQDVIHSEVNIRQRYIPGRKRRVKNIWAMT